MILKKKHSLSLSFHPETLDNWTMAHTAPPSVFEVSQADDDDGTDDNHHPETEPDQSNSTINTNKQQLYTSTPMRNRYKCLECSKTFFTRDELHRHISEDIFNLHECSHCACRFTDKAQLKRHESSHSKLNFVCNRCDKSFARYKQLVRHGLHCSFKMFIPVALN